MSPPYPATHRSAAHPLVGRAPAAGEVRVCCDDSPLTVCELAVMEAAVPPTFLTEIAGAIAEL